MKKQMSRNVNRNADRGRSVYVSVIVAIALVLTFAGGCYVYQFGGALSESHSRWGEFGDYLGGVLNPIFALIALMVLLYTVHLQTRELHLSTNELRNSASALREQSRSLQHQNFERTFFEMIQLHCSIIEDLDLRKGNVVTASGRDCFRVFCRRLRIVYDRVQETRPLDKVRSAYTVFHEGNQHEVGHYFRNLYRVLKYVHESNAVDKMAYAGILRAQLSSYELLLMYYGTLHPVGKNLKPLVETYALFDNLDPSLLFDCRAEANLFGLSAWGAQADVVAEYYKEASDV